MAAASQIRNTDFPKQAPINLPIYYGTPGKRSGLKTRKVSQCTPLLQSHHLSIPLQPEVEDNWEISSQAHLIS